MTREEAARWLAARLGDLMRSRGSNWTDFVEEATDKLLALNVCECAKDSVETVQGWHKCRPGGCPECDQITNPSVPTRGGAKPGDDESPTPGQTGPGSPCGVCLGCGMRGGKHATNCHKIPTPALAAPTVGEKVQVAIDTLGGTALALGMAPRSPRLITEVNTAKAALIAAIAEEKADAEKSLRVMRAGYNALNTRMLKVEDRAETAERELAAIDERLSGRPALAGLPTRAAKVERACDQAGQGETFKRERDEAKRELLRYKSMCFKGHDVPPFTCALCEVDRLKDERESLRAQLATVKNGSADAGVKIDLDSVMADNAALHDALHKTGVCPLGNCDMRQVTPPRYSAPLTVDGAVDWEAAEREVSRQVKMLGVELNKNEHSGYFRFDHRAIGNAAIAKLRVVEAPGRDELAKVLQAAYCKHIGCDPMPTLDESWYAEADAVLAMLRGEK